MTVIHVMENIDEAIEACPFCHVGGATLSVYQQGVQKFFVGCDNCGAEGRKGFSIREAVEMWNLVAGVPIDDLDYVIGNYVDDALGDDALGDDGKGELERVYKWLDKVKPIETAK